MTDSRLFLVRFALLEGVHLAQLVDEFCELIEGSRDASDPAVERLTPDVYPDDAEASRSFAESTRGELLDRRLADAAVVRSALEPFDSEDDSLNDDDVLVPRDVLIPATELDSWLRTLTALRLVIASRLDIADDDGRDPDDPRLGVYDWLGFRLEGLIRSADEQR